MSKRKVGDTSVSKRKVGDTSVRYLGLVSKLLKKWKGLTPLSMRLEVFEGILDALLCNDGRLSLKPVLQDLSLVIDSFNTFDNEKGLEASKILSKKSTAGADSMSEPEL